MAASTGPRSHPPTCCTCETHLAERGRAGGIGSAPSAFLGGLLFTVRIKKPPEDITSDRFVLLGTSLRFSCVTLFTQGLRAHSPLAGRAGTCIERNVGCN